MLFFGDSAILFEELAIRIQAIIQCRSRPCENSCVKVAKINAENKEKTEKKKQKTRAVMYDADVAIGTSSFNS